MSRKHSDTCIAGDSVISSSSSFFWRNPVQVAPAYERLELGIGDAVLQKAIQGATGRSAKDVIEIF